jgi:hypothetical protein
MGGDLRRIPLDCCYRYGVLCTDGNVTSINWNYLGLTGSVPPEIGMLKKLKYLQVSYNACTGKIPKEIGNLVNLEEL